MPMPFDERIGTVSSHSDHQKDLRYAHRLNRYAIILAVIATLILVFL